MTKSAENIEKKIEAQLEKLKQLQARKQAIEAREKSKQKEQQRKDDTRRKILLGSFLMNKMKSDSAYREEILVELDQYLRRNNNRKMDHYLNNNRDRKLFDLAPLDIFEKDFSSFGQAYEFSEKFVKPFGVYPDIDQVENGYKLWVHVEEYSDQYFKLAEVFYRSDYEQFMRELEEDERMIEEQYKDWDVEDSDIEGSDTKYPIIDVELDGYPRDYDRSLVNRR